MYEIWYQLANTGDTNNVIKLQSSLGMLQLYSFLFRAYNLGSYNSVFETPLNISSYPGHGQISPVHAWVWGSYNHKRVSCMHTARTKKNTNSQKLLVLNTPCKQSHAQELVQKISCHLIQEPDHLLHAGCLKGYVVHILKSSSEILFFFLSSLNALSVEGNGDLNTGGEISLSWHHNPPAIPSVEPWLGQDKSEQETGNQSQVLKSSLILTTKLNKYDHCMQSEVKLT